MADDEYLLDFYGEECVHCKEMDPVVKKLEKELKLKLKKLEVWHNEKNSALLREYDQGRCGGVPFFYNKKSGKFICGAVDYATLKNWALGK
ncbi:hypothetical protein HY643_00250 [Candidatus Woesearchaeota archaeon]|nr:hypothetical protein [Candidatus Woesearchaeota archaeon]